MPEAEKLLRLALRIAEHKDDLNRYYETIRRELRIAAIRDRVPQSHGEAALDAIHRILEWGGGE